MLKGIIYFIGRKLGIRKFFPELNIEFLWKPEDITAELRSDNAYLKIGKYIQLEQKLNEGEFGWKQSKFNIPNTWHVSRIKVAGDAVLIEVAEHGGFQINKDNFGSLSFAILDGGNKDDESLHNIWQKHAAAALHS